MYNLNHYFLCIPFYTPPRQIRGSYSLVILPIYHLKGLENLKESSAHNFRNMAIVYLKRGAMTALSGNGKSLAPDDVLEVGLWGLKK